MSQKGIPKNKPKIYETHPEFIKWIQNKDDAKRYSYGSTIKINWVCPNCGNIVNSSISHVIKRKHVPCRRCSDGISYPEKYMHSLLKQLQLDFETEYSPDWIKPKRYDFYIPSKKIIIEMDGLLGHGNKSFDTRYYNNANELLELDAQKDYIASQHGINVIRIDAKESNSEYLKNHILDSKLSSIFDLDVVDFLLCNSDAYSSMKIKVCDIWNKYHDMKKIEETTHLARITIVRYLTDCSKYGLCNYDSKVQQTNSGKTNIYKACYTNSRKVICLDTKEIYESMADAYRWLGYNPNGHSIRDNCNGITKTAGRHPITKNRLTWMWYDEYLSKGAV